MRVLGISGSLRRGLAQQRPAAGGRRAAARRGGAGRVRPPGARSRPTTRTSKWRRPRPWSRSCARRCASADAVLIATPEYNHSIPGQLKNALDWVSRPAGKSALNGKPAAAIGASTGMFGAVWAQAELRKVLGAMGGRVVEAELPVGHAKELLVGDRLELSPQQSEQLEEILAELVAAAEAEARTGRRGLEQPGKAKKATAAKWAAAAAMTRTWKTSW